MFPGVMSALITPFADGVFDRDAFAAHIEYQLAGGVDGVVPCGTTGESATLTHDEHKTVITACIEIVAGRVPVLAGTGSNSTAESVELTKFAQSAGADGALLITPYYNKPTQGGLIAHYKAVAEAVELPIVLYNVPGRTALNMLPETVAQLSDLPNVVAIKEATANMEQCSNIHRLCGDKISLISGDDATFLPFLSIGGSGVISVASNLDPKRMSAIYEHWNKGEIAQARAVHEELLILNNLLFCETSPIPVKAAVSMLGFCRDELRLPLLPMSDAPRANLRDELTRLGLPLK
ncbi:4-hydroxy-tetrahydrodipicolinate synthase [Magnetofaba australis]|uniref:4-hydroxy-tetrahydrodipicolinate synthase n=1 Tax=Magnetofaba australis IT-1 TaxID=1434232 RepID=A0A1Y2JYQ2_9PROT|nr:4-hydroxy-tetrahydrodipicolinate synthase [Magnetofaba australis]OSM00017.1 putative dihydrodipicolinate synthase [Magnetofaba australis IT-1]